MSHDLVEERKKWRDKLEMLKKEKTQLKDDIDGIKKSANYDWHICKQMGHKKYCCNAKKKYEKAEKMEDQLCDLNKEIKEAKDEWNKLKKIAA